MRCVVCSVVESEGAVRDNGSGVGRQQVVVNCECINDKVH